jgi:hypothetical protein
MRSVAAKADCPPVLAASAKDLNLMRPPALVAIVLIALAVTACSRTMPIYNVSSAPVAVPSEQLSAAQGPDAIIEAKAEQSSAAPGRGTIIDAKVEQSSATQADGAIIEAKTERSSATPVGDAITEAKTGQLSAAQVRGAIIEAATDRGWIVKEDDPGRILLEIFVRRHSAMVTIDYSPTTYDITYTDSENLLYDGSNIHRNYNGWILLLQQQINRRLNEA